MKQIASTYTYNKTNGQITLLGVTIDRDQLLLIVNTTRNITYYNFADSATTLQSVTQGTTGGGVPFTQVTLKSSVISASSTHANGDALTIYYDDQLDGSSVSLTGWELLGQRDFFADASDWVFNSSTIGLYSSLGITFGEGSSGSIQATYITSVGQDNDLYWTSLGGERTRVISSGTGLFTTMAMPADITISINSAPSSSRTASLYGKKDNVLPLTNTQLRASAIAVSGAVTPLQGSNATNTSFTSTTSATLVAANADREVLTVFNEGAGTLFINVGSSSCSTTSYQVRLASGEYWEAPAGQSSLAHTAIFGTAGTARVTQVI